jgi:hypothetical protein
MTALRKDLTATLLTALAVLVFAATHEAWSIWLVGDSHRLAAGAILMLGIGTCAQGEARKPGSARLLAALGVTALVLGAIAIATGSLTLLSLLVADIVLLWALTTTRHLFHVHYPLTG